MSHGISENVSLKGRTSWLVGGPAEKFCEPKNIQELKEILEIARENQWPLTVLGGGTNVLVSDKGISGLVLSTGKLSGIEIVEEGPKFKFWAWAGTSKSELLKVYLKKKLAPALMMAGLPGQVGGGVVMNAGVSEALSPREFCEITEAVEVIRPDGSLEVIQSADLSWSYRHCEGWRPGIITRALLSWPLEPNEDILQQVKDLNLRRMQKQPLDFPSCGSVFRNPLPHKSGSLIEQAGLKGYSIGGAQVSEKHANFIINKGSATATDIGELMAHCQSEVKKKFDVELRTEVVFLGN